MPAIFPSSKTRIGPLVFDGTTSDEHSLTVSTTDQVIASGARITDHAIVDPRPLKLEVVTTRSRGSASFDAQPSDFNPARHAMIYAQLCELAKARLLVRIVTAVEAYSSMLIVSVGYARNSQRDLHRRRIVVMAREILTAEIVPVQNLADAAIDVAAPASDIGAVGLEATEEIAIP